MHACTGNSYMWLHTNMYGLTPPLPTPSLPQGEAIDRIEDNVNAAADHVQRGTHAVRTAVPYARRNRKVWQIYLPCAFVIECSPHMTSLWLTLPCIMRTYCTVYTQLFYHFSVAQFYTFVLRSCHWTCFSVSLSLSLSPLLHSSPLPLCASSLELSWW